MGGFEGYLRELISVKAVADNDEVDMFEPTGFLVG
jgi:hypothetical protein